MTGKFHKSSQVFDTSLLKKSRRVEYVARASIFSEFRELVGEEIYVMSQYFASSAFANIYDNLPHAFIHGDNNISNIVVSNEIPYFVDLDSARFDVRLLDLVTLIRFGYLEDYLDLEDFRSFINSSYGEFAGSLNSLEKEHFHEMVLFTHIEFLSWALTMLEQASTATQISEFQKYVNLYLEQLAKLTKKERLAI